MPSEPSEAVPVQLLASENANPRLPDPVASQLTVIMPPTSLPKSNIRREPLEVSVVSPGYVDKTVKSDKRMLAGETVLEDGECLY